MRERADGRPRAPREPAYVFLDRVAGERWQRVRDTLDGWFLRLPPAARADLRNRFAQPSELDHAGAFWELWVHEAHRRRGFEVAVNIGVEAGERRQDFVIGRGRERCWLEATVVGGDGAEGVRPLRRKIKKKAARYGALDRPYLLAVLALGDRVGPLAIEHALLGGAQATRSCSGLDHAVWLGPDGPRNTRLSGVLVARGLRSTDPAAPVEPVLWRNPWALRPLGSAVALAWRCADRGTVGRRVGRVVVPPGRSVAVAA